MYPPSYDDVAQFGAFIYINKTMDYLARGTLNATTLGRPSTDSDH
jgi:hypothetical protein